MKELAPVPPDALAVETRDLRKEFVTRTAAAASAARGRARGQPEPSRSRAVKVRSDHRPERLGQVDAGPAALDAPPAGRRRRARVRLRRRPRRQVRPAPSSTCVSVEASFFKKMSPSENLHYAARFYGMTPSETAEQIPAILGRVGFPARPAG